MCATIVFVFVYVLFLLLLLLPVSVVVVVISDTVVGAPTVELLSSVSLFTAIMALVFDPISLRG